ncbi:MAG TPA: hypothetical protein VGL63_00810 [Streptosporangiaceae bacterium]
MLRLLAGHPDPEIAAVAAGSSTGKPIRSIQPNLTGYPRFCRRSEGGWTTRRRAGTWRCPSY